MKNKLGILLCIAAMVLAGCAQGNLEATTEPEITKTQPTETQLTETQLTEIETLDEATYIGEYLDYDNNEPNLEIAKGDNGKYIVQIRIFRLTTLSDGIGELTPEGMLFTATDAAGNPISGIITVENQIATVTFTDSSWDLLESGSVYQYRKSADIPNVWSES